MAVGEMVVFCLRFQQKFVYDELCKPICVVRTTIKLTGQEQNMTSPLRQPQTDTDCDTDIRTCGRSISRASVASSGKNWPQYFGSSSVPCLQSDTPSQNLYAGMHFFLLTPGHILLPGGQSSAKTPSVERYHFLTCSLFWSTNTFSLLCWQVCWKKLLLMSAPHKPVFKLLRGNFKFFCP